MRGRSVVAEAKQINLASSLIHLGARLQVLESETSLSRERLLRLYKEVRGKSPPKGMLPYSTDWFLTWQPNIHASLFIGIYGYLVKQCHQTRIDALVRAYRLYLAGCAMTFEQGWIGLHQILATRPDGQLQTGSVRGAQSTYPFNREYMYPSSH